MIEHAIAAVARGMHIFPTNEAGSRDPVTGADIDKQPHLLEPGKPYKIKWAEAATDDWAQVLYWWKMWPQANVAVACKPSGILVVDCDQPKTNLEAVGTPYEDLYKRYNGRIDGYDVYREMCLRSGGDWGATTDTFTVGTGSGGVHFVYRWPVGVQASQGSLLRGLLDIRCNGGDKGGYVLAPGSRTYKGSYDIEADLPVADCPVWLVERCRERIPVRVQPPRSAPRDSGTRGYAQPGRSADAVGSHEGILDAVRYCPPGNRNNVVLWASRQLYTEGMELAEAEGMLTEAGAIAGLQDADVRATVRSGYRAQQRKEG